MIKILLLRSDLDKANKALADLTTEREAREKRSAELEAEIREMLDEGKQLTEEERAAVDKEVSEIEAANDTAAKTEADIRAQIARIEKEIADLEAEKRAAVESAVKKTTKTKEENKRTEGTIVRTYATRALNEMSAEQRTELVEHADNKKLFEQLRAISGNPNLNVAIPTIDLPMLSDAIGRESKLIKHVNRQTVRGLARQRVLGIAPEAVWTEMGGKINELSLATNSVMIDGYKVAAFVPVENYLLEDNDVNLLDAVISTLAKAIAKAVDKAILFGTGDDGHMPTGIVTAILADNGIKATNVTNISAANSTGITLFKKILEAFGAAKDDYSNGEKCWGMSAATYNRLLSEAMSINAAGAITSGMQKTMPVVGGDVEIINQMPDNVIVGGYGDLYLLGERQSVTMSNSPHVRFLDDQTCFKAVARYDGKPTFPEAFVCIGIGGTAVATAAATVTFAEDTANAVANAGD